MNVEDLEISHSIMTEIYAKHLQFDMVGKPNEDYRTQDETSMLLVFVYWFCQEVNPAAQTTKQTLHLMQFRCKHRDNVLVGEMSISRVFDIGRIRNITQQHKQHNKVCNWCTLVVNAIAFCCR